MTTEVFKAKHETILLVYDQKGKKLFEMRGEPSMVEIVYKRLNEDSKNNKDKPD